MVKKDWIPAFAGMTIEKGATASSRTMSEKRYYVYILASGRNGTLYIGMTSDLARRVWEHKSAEVEGFSKRYRVTNLVYYEVYDSAEQAILRERRTKAWKRSWKIRLIENSNPGWRDLYEEICK